MSGRVQHRNAQLAHRLQVVLLFRDELGLRAAGNCLRPQRSVAAAIRNERDPLSIRRPARRYVVEIAIGKRKRIAALGGHHPELVPLLSQIRRVDDALAVGRKIRARLPGGLFVMNLARLGARLRLHPPEAAGAVNVPAVRNEKNFFPVRRPGRADLMIELAVVVARESAAVLSGQALDVFQFAVAELPDENVEASVERSGNECDPLAVGRKTGLEVDRAAGRELPRAFVSRFRAQSSTASLA